MITRSQPRNFNYCTHWWIYTRTKLYIVYIYTQGIIHCVACVWKCGQKQLQIPASWQVMSIRSINSLFFYRTHSVMLL